MARHNFVLLLGMCRAGTVVIGDLYPQAYCPVSVVRSTRDDNAMQVEKGKKYATPLILADSPALIKEMASWKKNDIVLVTGFIATRDMDKKSICPHCQYENRREEAVANAKSGGNMIYISPISAERVASFENETEAFLYLIKHEEISNKVFLLGNLTKDPLQGVFYYKNMHTGNPGKKPYTRFQIAVNRKYHPQGVAQIRERTDYPWIYSYGPKGEIDYQVLRAGSKVYIDGALQTRSYVEDYRCTNPDCGKKYQHSGKTLEVISYSTEYLTDYDPIGDDFEDMD